MVLPGLIVVIFMFQGFTHYYFVVTGDELWHSTEIWIPMMR